MKFEIFKAKKGKYKARLVGVNGVLMTTNSHSSKKTLLRDVNEVRATVGNAEVVEL